jgi:hypothetical protein
MKKLVFLLSILSCLCKGQGLSLEWAIGIGEATTNMVIERAMVHDHAGNVCIAGEYNQTVDFDPGPGVVNLSFMGDKDIFVSKFDASGKLLWAKGIGGAGIDRVISMETDMSGNIYVMGYFQGSVDFDPGPGTAILTAGTDLDAYLLKLDGAGNFTWAKMFNGNNGNSGFGSLATDAGGNVYVTGFYIGTVDFDPGSATYPLTSTAPNGDLFILKLNPLGNFVWVKSASGTVREMPAGIKIDGSGNIYIAGTYLGTADFDPGPGTATLSAGATTGNASFILKLDSSGNFKWIKGFSGNGNTSLTSLATDAGGNVYAAGAFNSTADFDPGVGAYPLSSTANSNAVVLKLDSLGSFVWAKDFKTATGPHSCVIQSMALDNLDNVYTIGRYQDNVDFDPGSSVFNMFGNDQVFISRLDRDGNFSWAGNFAGFIPATGNSSPQCQLSIDPSYAVYASGNFWRTQDFDPGPGTYTLTTGNNYAPFVTKFMPDIVGLADLKNHEEVLSIYPNPNPGIFEVQLDANFEHAELLIFNSFGQEIKRQPLVTGSNDIILKDCSAGLYYYSVLQNNRTLRSGKISVY